MRVIASSEAADLVRERGGRLFVWVRSSRCCGRGVSWLEASTEPAEGREYRCVEADGMELYVPAGLPLLPDELHLEARGLRRKRVEAYWDGCAWVT